MEGHIHNVEHKPARTKKELKKEHRSFWRIVGSFILDMLPIVFGILIAVGINSWKEKGHTKDLEKFYLLNIKENIDDNIKGLEFDVKAFSQILEIQKFFLRGNNKENIDSLRMFYRFFYIIQPQFQNTGFLALQNTGKLDVLSNLQIIQHLTTLYQVDIRTLETLINDYNLKYNNFFLHYIINSEIKNRIHRMNDAELLQLTAPVKFQSIISQFHLDAIVGKYHDIIKQHRDISMEIKEELKGL